MKYLSDYSQQMQTELFNSTGAFFAFSSDQFNEEKKEGITYVNLGCGMLCPKSNVDKLIKGLEEINVKARKQDLKENGAKAIIEREYFNYECQLTMNTKEAFNALSGYIKLFPNEFTKELINKTFAKCFETAIQNDWF